MLTGPILRSSTHRSDSSRVLVFVDQSKSMTLTDETMKRDRKLLNARRLGWVEEDSIDTSLYDASQLLGSVRKMPPGTDAQEVLRQYERYIYAAIDLFDDNDPNKARLQRGLTRSIERIHQRLDDDDISDAQLQSEIEEVRKRSESWSSRLEGEYRQLVGEVSPSDSSDIEITKLLDELTRWKRAEAALLTNRLALIPEIIGQHQVDLFSFSGGDSDGKAIQLWQPENPDDEVPETFDPLFPNGAKTDLAAEIDRMVSDLPTGNRLSVVLITDGQHNQRTDGFDSATPIHVAQMMGRRGVPIYPVGFGASAPPPDLAILGLQTPEAVFVDDRVKGKIELKDYMPRGESAEIKIEVDGELVWSQHVVTDESGRRLIDFDFPVKDAVEHLIAGTPDQNEGVSTLLPMKVMVEQLDDELRDDNNEFQGSVRAIMRPRRALIVDGRPRWEFRYLRNLLARDKHWEVNPVQLRSRNGGLVIPRGDSEGTFPTSIDSLFAYDVIVIGDVNVGLFTAEEQNWIQQFVSDRGGGLMLIDGQRGRLRRMGDANSKLSSLLPVRWVGPHSSGLREVSLELTPQGSTVPALGLDGDNEQSKTIWSSLPSLHWVARVKAMPGCDTLLAGNVGAEKHPILVMRRFGAGIVLYSGMDETWRWRYEYADRFHAQYWNQMATFIMESPYAVHDEFVSIDTGGFSYRPGESANLKIRLRDEDGRPVVNRLTNAQLYKNDKVVATIPLKAIAGGIMRGKTPPLEPGEYQVGVTASGYDEESLSVRADLIVQGDVWGELNALHCNEPLLRQLADLSGGQFLREEDIGRLPDLLARFADSREEVSEIVLWRSWYWFIPLVGLFTVEWLLRKKLGLM